MRRKGIRALRFLVLEEQSVCRIRILSFSSHLIEKASRPISHFNVKTLQYSHMLSFEIGVVKNMLLEFWTF